MSQQLHKSISPEQLRQDYHLADSLCDALAEALELTLRRNEFLEKELKKANRSKRFWMLRTRDALREGQLLREEKIGLNIPADLLKLVDTEKIGELYT